MIFLSYPRVDAIVGNHAVKLEARIWENITSVNIHTFGSDKASHSPEVLGCGVQSAEVSESSSMRLRASRISSSLNQPGFVVSGKSGRINIVQKATTMVSEPSM